jgi:hypothetical protein
MVLAGLGLLLFSSLTAYAKEAPPPPPGWAWGKENNPGNHYGQISNPGHHYAYGRYKHQTPPPVTPPTVTPPTPNGHQGHNPSGSNGTQVASSNVGAGESSGLPDLPVVLPPVQGGPADQVKFVTADPDNPYEWLVLAILPALLAIWLLVAARAALNAARGRKKAAA